MGKGHYRGGSTIIGPGRIWSDHADFPEVSTANARSPIARKKAKHLGKKRPSTKLAKSGATTLIIPIRQAQLIAAILKDLGRSPPRKRNRFNNLLRDLISDGVISSKGKVNKNHPMIQKWFQKVEAQKLTEYSAPTVVD